MTDKLVGQVLGHYRIIERIGQGGMAVVYKGHDIRLERDVAIKVIRKGAFPEDQQTRILQRFEREAKSMARLSHANIVRVYDSGDFEGSPYIVMDYLGGGTLKDRIGKPIAWRQAVQTLVPVARALAYAHKLGIVHRDVKPANILFSTGGEPILSDFGVVKLLENEEGQTLTDSGVGIGTPEYMAPEQGKGEKKIDARVDIYALGIVLYEMVTGRKPFSGDTPMQVVIKHVTEPLPRPTQYVPSLPLGVENLLVKALAKNPSERYLDMDAYIAALLDLLALDGKAETRDKTESTILAQPVTIDSDPNRTFVQPPAGVHPPYSTQANYQPPPKKQPAWIIPAVLGALGCVGLVAVVFIVILLNGNNFKVQTTSPTGIPPVFVATDTPEPNQPTALPNQPTYTPYPTNTPYPTDVPATPTKSQANNVDQSCPGLNWNPRAKIGQTVRICTIYRLVLRPQPDSSNEIIALFWDNNIKLVDGPKCGKDAWWWKVDVPIGTKYSPSSTVDYADFGYTKKIYTGWVKEGLNRELLPDSKGYYLCPVK